MLMKDNSIPGDIKQQLKNMFPQFTAEKKSEPKEEDKEAPSTGEYTKARIQRIVDGLDEQLAQGKISEKTYHKLRKKWEAKLES
jgi:hypothetical protein